MGVYLLVNLGYSFGLKNVPILDVALLVSGFLLRVLFGASVTGITISNWLYLTVVSISFYLSRSASVAASCAGRATPRDSCCAIITMPFSAAT